MMQSSFLRVVLLIIGALLIGGTVLFFGARALWTDGFQTVISAAQSEVASPFEEGRTGDADSKTASDSDEMTLADSLKTMPPLSWARQSIKVKDVGPVIASTAQSASDPPSRAYTEKRDMK